MPWFSMWRLHQQRARLWGNGSLTFFLKPARPSLLCGQHHPVTPQEEESWRSGYFLSFLTQISATDKRPELSLVPEKFPSSLGLFLPSLHSSFWFLLPLKYILLGSQGTQIPPWRNTGHPQDEVLSLPLPPAPAVHFMTDKMNILPHLLVLLMVLNVVHVWTEPQGLCTPGKCSTIDPYLQLLCPSGEQLCASHTLPYLVRISPGQQAMLSHTTLTCSWLGQFLLVGSVRKCVSLCLLHWMACSQRWGRYFVHHCPWHLACPRQMLWKYLPNWEQTLGMFTLC